MSRRKQKAPQKRVLPEAQPSSQHPSVTEFRASLVQSLVEQGIQVGDQEDARRLLVALGAPPTIDIVLNPIAPPISTKYEAVRLYEVFHARDVEHSKELVVALTNLVNPHVQVKMSTIANAGYGLFAAQSILAGSLVTGYGGILMSHNFYQSNAELLGRFPGMDGYMVELPNGSFLDGRTVFKLGGEAGRWINDSNTPNCQFVFSDVLQVRALRDIAVGEELFINYGKHYWGGGEESEQKRLKACVYCGKPAQFKCGHCLNTYYCGKSCQLADMDAHMS